MLKESEIEILSELRWILKLTNLYNENGVYFKYSRNGDSVKIPDFIVFCLVAFPTFYLGSLAMWLVIEEKFNLKLISCSLSGAIALFLATLNYISLATKTDSVLLIINHMQEVVERSKYPNHCENDSILSFIYLNCVYRM